MTRKILTNREEFLNFAIKELKLNNPFLNDEKIKRIAEIIWELMPEIYGKSKND